MIRHNDIVTLFSNAQERTFPENTAYRFTNRLPHVWKLPEAENWRVGLTEFSTLDTLDTIPVDLKLNVSIAGNHIKAQCKDRHNFFKVGLPINPVELTEPQFQSRVLEMQRYCYPIAPEHDDCKNPFNHFINGLDGVTRQMMNQSCYDTYLLFVRDGDATKLAVKENNKLFSNYRFVVGPGIQQLLMLNNPTGVQSLASFDTLKKRFVLSKSGEHCDFRYRILPSDGQSKVMTSTTFSKSDGQDPFSVLKSLAERYDFFDFEETVDGENTIATVKFTERRNITMVQLPDDFLHLKEAGNISFKLGLSTNRYQIVDKSKNPIKDQYPLGQHVKDGKITSFFMTDGTEMRFSRKTKDKKTPPSGYSFAEMTFTVYFSPSSPVVQRPYNADFVIPRGSYTMDTFVSTLDYTFKNQNVFEFQLRKKTPQSSQRKRIKLNEDRYRFSIKPIVRGYTFTFDPKLQSILAIDKNHFGSSIEELRSSRDVLLSSFTYNLMLYCNFIKPSIQGGQYEKILRTIPFPTKNKKGENFMVEFKHIQFHDIPMSNVQDFSVEIRDDTGELVNFKDGRTTLKLVFKRE